MYSPIGDLDANRNKLITFVLIFEGINLEIDNLLCTFDVGLTVTPFTIKNCMVAKQWPS